MDYEEFKTAAIPPQDYMSIQILRRYERIVDAIERYNLYKLSGASAPTSDIKSKVQSLFIQIYGQIKRDYDNDKFIILKNKIESREIHDVLEAFYELSSWLDTKGLKFDSQVRYDISNPERENRIRSL